MKNHFAIHFDDRMIHKVFLFFLAAALSVNCISLLAAQQKDKKKKKDSTTATDSSNTLIPLSDEQQIDYMLSEMWAPPVIGWTSYLAIYQQQRARMQQVRMDRLNTYIKVNGATGWACYQWDFAAIVDGQPVSAQGQTTVVLEKRSNRWVIVHNHTSLVQNLQPAVPANAPSGQQQPAKPPPR